MPSATPAQSKMAGIKRKADAPAKVSKSGKSKDSKKPKIHAAEPSRKVSKKPIPSEAESSDDDGFEGFEPDGGVSLSESSPDGTDGNIHPDRAKASKAGLTSREAHAKQKQEKKERRANKPLADQLQRTKKIWERLRRKSHVPLEERKKLVAELFETITGRVKEFVLKHDATRVIQTAIKYANLEQRKMIARELQGTFKQLAESKYAKFLVGKLLVESDEEIRNMVISEFYGNVTRMIKHPEASWILDDIYRGMATKQQKAIMLREWYGGEFSIFRGDSSEPVTSDLSEILAESPGKRTPILRYLHELINHLVQKKFTGFTMLHDAMLQYFLNVKPGSEEAAEFLELIKGDDEGDLLKNLAFTDSGSKVVSYALAYGGAKDRKQILKVYKDTIQLMASDAYGHRVILTAYEVIDDTVLTAKTIFPELLGKESDKQIENTLFAANDINARTTLLYLYAGRSKALFPSSLSSDLTLLKEVDEIRQQTSKKDPEIRQKELAKALSPYLLPAIERTARDLVSSSFGCQFITEVMFGAEGDKSTALQAIAETARGDPTEVLEATEEADAEADAPPSRHIATDQYGSRMLKALISGGHFSQEKKAIIPVEPRLNFANTLYPVIKPHIVEWATGPGSFVVVALTEATDFSKHDDLLKSLRKNKAKLEKAATEETEEQKARRITDAEDNSAATKEKTADKKGNGKAKNKTENAKEKEKSRPAGNAGSKLLLQKL